MADTTFAKWSNITSDRQIKIKYLWYDLQHHFYSILAKKKEEEEEANPEFNHEEILDKPNWRPFNEIIGQYS